MEVNLSKGQEDFIAYQEYMIKTVCSCMGVPHEIIERPKDTRWKKFKRKLRSLVWMLGSRKKEMKSLRGASLIGEAIIARREQMIMEKTLSQLRNGR